MHTVSIKPDQTATTSPVRLQRLTAAQPKRQKGAEDRHARQDASEWVEAHHPEKVCHIAELGKRGTKSTPWKAIPLGHPLAAALNAKGPEYAAAFLDEAYARCQWIELAWRYTTYAEGVSDGQRWAVTFATPGQLERLRAALRNSGPRMMIWQTTATIAPREVVDSFRTPGPPRGGPWALNRRGPTPRCESRPSWKRP